MSDELLQQRYNLKNNKYQKELDIRKIDEEIKELDIKIFRTCDHNWIYNKWCNWDDLCKYYCDRCGLYRNFDLTLSYKN